jgi:hypothetical protein
LAIGSSSAGNRVMIRAPLGVTITSSSMRAAEMPADVILVEQQEGPQARLDQRLPNAAQPVGM